jgi:hypothetical protein
MPMTSLLYAWKTSILVFLQSSPCSSNLPSLVVCPCSLIEIPKVIIASFGGVVSLRKPMCPNESLCPFVDPVAQTNRHAPSWIRSPKQIIMPLRGPSLPNKPMRSPIVVPLGTVVPQPWCALHASALQSLGHFILRQAPWCVHMPKAPTCPTCATLGCQSNPKFRLLKDLVKVLRAHLSQDLTSSPTSSCCHP